MAVGTAGVMLGTCFVVCDGANSRSTWTKNYWEATLICSELAAWDHFSHDAKVEPCGTTR